MYIIIYKIFKAYKNVRLYLVAQLVKNSRNAGRLDQFLDWGRSLERTAYPLQYS